MTSRTLRSSRQSDATSQEVPQQPAKKRRLNPKNNPLLQPTRGQPANAQWVTYRVSGIPDTYDRASFDDAFSASLQLTSQSIKSTIHSFASDGPKERTATVTFTTTPSALDAAGAHNTQEWDIDLVHPILGQTNRVSIDTHFKGFTPVSPLGEDTEHVIDCIAIHGLGSHPLGGFKAHNDTYVWLRDKLAIRIPRLRVFIYGYKCDLTTDDSISGVHEWADTLRRLLRQMRGQDNTGPPVPLVFFAHSLGGIVLKQALIQMNESSDDNDDRNLHSVYGALFFGVPSQGMDIKALAAMVGDKPQRYTLFLLDQKVGYPLRKRQHEEFCRALDFEGSKIIHFYETRMTSTVIEDPVTNKWTRTGKKKLLVNPESATLGRAGETSNDYRVSIDADHSNMVKFSRSDRDGSVKAYDEMQKFADEAVMVIEKRFPRRARGKLSPRDHAQKHGHVPDRSMEPEDLTCLRSLAFPEMESRRIDTQREYPKTCEWVTRHPSYTSWLEDSSGILWIKGKPGSGKSTLMNFLFRDFEQQDLYPKSIRLSFFFHGRGTTLQKSRLGMYRSLLHQLLRSAPYAQEEFRQAVQEKSSYGAHGKDWNWHENELSDLFMNAVEHAAKTKPINIFVDALDEASDGNDDETTRQRILSDFYKLNDLFLAKKLRSTICFSCRHQPVIAENQVQKIVVEKGNGKDISAYVHDKLYKSLGTSKSNKQYLVELQDTIVEKARGVFQWAVLVVPLAIRYNNKGRSRDEMRQMLKQVPEELGEVYQHILERVIDQEDYPKTLQLMRWVYLAERPLTITEMRFAMRLPASEETVSPESSLAELEFQSEEEMVKRISSLSGGLIETKQHESDQIVQVIHQSVNDFLRDKGLRFFDKTSKDPIGKGHCQISVGCANYMRTTGMYSANGLDAESVKTKLPFIDYVARSWFLHAEKAETGGALQDYLLRYIQYDPSMLENWVRFYRLLDPYSHSERRPEESSTMLHIASGAGLLSVVKGLLLTPQDLEQIDNAGNRAIHYACRWGHLKVVKALLDAGAFFEIENSNMSTPLERAAANGHEEIVELLLIKGADVNKQTGPTGNPLYGASLKGKRAVVQLLLDKQADVNAQGGQYGNALQAAACSGHQAVVQLLLDKQADVNAKGGDFGNALQAAACSGSQAVVQLLLDKQADVNAQGGQYGNALQAALYAGHELIVHLLYKNSASSMDKDSQGRYPLHLAIRGGHYQTINLVLSKIGTPDWKYQDMQGCSALHFAASSGSDMTLQAVLDSNIVNINLADTFGWTALHWACRNGSHKIVRILREYGADSNQKDSNGWTPLDVAIFCRNKSLASLFQDDKIQIKSEQPRAKPGNYQGYDCSSCYYGIYSKRHHCEDCGCEGLDPCLDLVPLSLRHLRCLSNRHHSNNQ